jgi:hypothetical protein
MHKLYTNSGFPELFLKYMTVSCDVTVIFCIRSQNKIYNSKNLFQCRKSRNWVFTSILMHTFISY